MCMNGKSLHHEKLYFWKYFYTVWVYKLQSVWCKKYFWDSNEMSKGQWKYRGDHYATESFIFGSEYICSVPKTHQIPQNVFKQSAKTFGILLKKSLPGVRSPWAKKRHQNAKRWRDNVSWQIVMIFCRRLKEMHLYIFFFLEFLLLRLLTWSGTAERY